MKQELSLYENVQQIATRTFKDVTKIVMDKTLDAVAETTSMVMQEASKKDLEHLPLQVVSTAEIRKMVEYVAEAQQAIERAERTLLMYTRVYETSLALVNDLHVGHPDMDKTNYDALIEALVAVNPSRVKLPLQPSKQPRKRSKTGGR